MISLKFDSTAFQKEMQNFIDYSTGFVEGIPAGKREFLNAIGPIISEKASEFVDMNARVDPITLHHVYEWYKEGNPADRLFNINYTISNLGLSFSAGFTQSTSIKSGSSVPFYNKAEIMELGMPVVIKPVHADVLRFQVGNETIYTRKPVVVNRPGGNTKGEFAQVFDTFFSKYFTQSFMRSSGLNTYFANPIVYKENLKSGIRIGRSKGYSVGYRWVANAGKVA